MTESAPGRVARRHPSLSELLGGGLIALLAVGCRGGGVTPIRTAFNKGVYHYSQGDYAAAVAEYCAALDENQDDHRARFNLAVALETQATSVDAATGVQLREMAAAEYRRILEKRPRHLRASINLAGLEYESGKREAATRRIQESLRDHPGAAAPRIALAAHLLRPSPDATAAEREKALHESLLLLDDALRRGPTRTDANMLKGDVCLELGLLQRNAPGTATDGDDDTDYFGLSRDAYGRALARDPSDVATLMALARLQREEGDFAAAITWLKRVVYIDPSHRAAHWQLARAFEETGDLESATTHLWAARELDGPTSSRIPAEEYQNRLLDLYSRLIERERQPPRAPD